MPRPAASFRRDDESADEQFYMQPRLVTHIDDAAISAVTQLYRELFSGPRRSARPDEQLGEPSASRGELWSRGGIGHEPYRARGQSSPRRVCCA